MSGAMRDKLLRAGSDDTVISRADSGKTLRQILIQRGLRTSLCTS
jgi:hypothetical protein